MPDEKKPLDLKAIRERASAATPGPWRADARPIVCCTLPHRHGLGDCDYRLTRWDDQDEGGLVWAAADGTSIDHDGGGYDDPGQMKPADARFIAAARQDVPALCDALEEAQADWRNACDVGRRLETELNAKCAELAQVEKDVETMEHEFDEERVEATDEQDRLSDAIAILTLERANVVKALGLGEDIDTGRDLVEACHAERQRCSMAVDVGLRLTAELEAERATTREAVISAQRHDVVEWLTNHPDDVTRALSDATGEYEKDIDRLTAELGAAKAEGDEAARDRDAFDAERMRLAGVHDRFREALDILAGLRDSLPPAALAFLKEHER